MQPVEPFVERHVRASIEEALADTPVVVIQGARQVGTSTLAASIADAVAPDAR